MCTYQRIAAALFCCCIVTGLALCLTPYRIWHLRQVHSAEQPQALRAGREQAASSLIYETRPDAVVMEDDPILVRGTATPSGKVQQSGHLSAVPPAHRAWSPHGLVVPPCSTWSWHSRMAAPLGEQGRIQPIKSFCIVSERSSGSNYLESLVKKNLQLSFNFSDCPWVRAAPRPLPGACYGLPQTGAKRACAEARNGVRPSQPQPLRRRAPPCATAESVQWNRLMTPE